PSVGPRRQAAKTDPKRSFPPTVTVTRATPFPFEPSLRRCEISSTAGPSWVAATVSEVAPGDPKFATSSAGHVSSSQTGFWAARTDTTPPSPDGEAPTPTASESPAAT